MTLIRPGLLARASLGSSLSLTRTTLGRLAAHSDSVISGVTTAFATANWVAPTNITLAINSGRLEVTQTAAANSRFTKYNLADRADAHQQVVWFAEGSTAQRAGLVARGNTGASPPATWILCRRPGAVNTTNQYGQMFEIQSSSTLQTVSSSPTDWQGALPHRIALAVSGTTLATMYDWSQASRLSLGTLTVTSAAGFGIITSHDGGSGSRVFQFSEYYAAASHLLTVTTALGYDMRVNIYDAGSVLLATADGSGGSTTVNFDASLIQYPAAVTIEVQDLNNGLATLGTATPAERLWGGDVWEIA